MKKEKNRSTSEGSEWNAENSNRKEAIESDQGAVFDWIIIECLFKG